MEEEKRQQIYKLILIVVIVACIATVVSAAVTFQYALNSYPYLGGEIKNYESTEVVAKSLSNFRRIIDNNFKGEINERNLLNGAIKGYVNALNDKYTTYYTNEEWAEYQESVLGNFVGIGVYMTLTEDNKVVVVSPIEGSPAEKVGIKSGDIIAKVNDEDISGLNTDQVSNKIKGEEGTNVKVQVKRGEEYIDFDINREKIKIYHINSKILDNNIGYIKLESFDDECSKEFHNKLMELKDAGVTKLVLDLRDNTGGIVDEALNIADMFIEKGNNLLITEDNKENRVTTTAKTEALVDMDVVILINKYTASSSEILTGALVDNKIATTVGIKTYGKGVIQQIFQLQDGSALKITTEEYYTPNGTKIHGVGIRPDVEIEADSSSDEDNQLQKAVEILSNR